MPYVWDYKPTITRKRTKDFIIWKLTRQINYGLKTGEKMNAEQLKKYWRLVKADPAKKAALRSILWPKKH